MIILLFAGCQIKNYTPEIPSAFDLNATVNSGDFSYTCRICKSKDSVDVLVTSTSAQNMLMRYDGQNLTFKYEDFSYGINSENFERNNAAIVVYEVFAYINNTPELNAQKIEGGFKYEGSISSGDFIMIQNDDNSLDSISFRKSDLSIVFEQTAS